MSLGHLTPEQIQTLIRRIPELPLEEKVEILEYIEQTQLKEARKAAREDFLVFCHRVYPGFKEGPHHRHLKPMLHDMCRPSDYDWKPRKEAPPHALRLTVSMAPRFGKSETISYLYVAWYLGHNPTHQILMITHTAELSASFGRKVRDLIDSEEYQGIFEGSCTVSKDKSAADNWTTEQKGVYIALGVGGNVAGKGAHLLVCDDLVSEQAVLYGNPEIAFEQAWNYIQVGPLQRLMPGGRIIMIGTRWGKRDPIARAIAWSRDNEDALPWHEVRFPAVMEVERDGEKQMVSLWPEQWSVKELLAKKANMQPQFWAAQYMQEPTSDGAALIKREQWNIWPGEEPPNCHYIIQAWDTAHETKTRNDHSACTTWGVFYYEPHDRDEIILLDRWVKRVEYPELKKKAKELYNHWKPDELLIEKKAAGAPLIQEMRASGVFVTAVTPSRGTRAQSNDKYARVNAISPLFHDGCVWAPDTRWARELMENAASFPNGEMDDDVDTMEMSLARFRRGGFIRLSDDEEEEDNSSYAAEANYY